MDNKQQQEEEEIIEPIYTNETLLSNPIQISIVSFHQNKINHNDIEYEFKIYYKYDHWFIHTSLIKVIDYIQALHDLKYAFIPLKNINSLKSQQNITQLNKTLLNIMKYLTYRNDILSNPLSTIFFNLSQCPKQSQLNKYLHNDNLNLLYKFTIESGQSELTASDIKYDYESSLLLLAYEDNTLTSIIGRFWSLIDAEPLGSFIVYQKVSNSNKYNKPNFIKKISKSFDVRLSKTAMSNKMKKIFVGFDNGIVHTFNVNYGNNNFVSQMNSGNNLISITEGIKFKYLTDRITGFAFLDNYAFISSKENKIIILQFTYEYPSAMPEILFNASLKKRIEGKGYIKDIQIDKTVLNKLYILTEGKVILLYDIIKNCNDIKISFAIEINCNDTIQSIYFKSDSLFINLRDHIQYFKLDQYSSSYNKENSIISFNEKSINEQINYSSTYFTIEPLSNNQIASIVFFSQIQLFILGLSNGILTTINSKTYEVIYAKAISSHSLIQLYLFEEKRTLVICDSKGSIFFLQFGSII